MVGCCVSSCGNTFVNSRNKFPAIRFHSFPSNLDIRNNWKTFTGITSRELEKHKDKRVCSAHFINSDYINGDRSRRLTLTAVPTIRSQQVPRRPPIIKLKPKKKKKIDIIKEVEARMEKKHKREISEIESQLKSMRKKMSKVELENIGLKSKFTNLSKENEKLHSKLNAVSSKFTETQLDVIYNEKTKTWWPEADIARSLAMMMKSKHAYEFLRSTWDIPLPSLSTIARHIGQITITPGLIHPVLNLMKEYFKDMSEVMRQGVLVHDEVNLEAVISYDPSADAIYGPNSNATLMVVRGLYAKWKFPIYYGYNDKYSRDTFNLIVSELNAVGVNVVAVTCDNSGTNRGIWTKLGVDHNETDFPNVETGDPIYCVSDVPHCLKLLRNNLMDYGFVLKDGTKITQKDFKLLLRKLEGLEINIAHKLTPSHLYCRGSERQNVRLAAELFSRTTARAFRTLMPEKSRIAEFLELVNDAFDLLNSRTTYSRSIYQQPYGKYLDEQNKILDKFCDEILNMRMIGSRCKTLFPFQKGFLMTINSLKNLYLTQRLKFNIQYIFTHRLNQDLLENAFSVIRGMGKFKMNPNCTDFKYRLRRLILYWHFYYNNHDIEDNEDDEPRCILSPLKITQPAHDTIISNLIETQLQEAKSAVLEVVSASNWSQFMAAQPEAEFGGQEFIAGFLVRKFKEKFPEFALSEVESQIRTPLSFTQHLSDGNLTVPSYYMLNLFLKWEKYFVAVHGNSGDKWKLNRSFNITKYLAERIEKDFPTVPKKIIHYYSRVRTFIRIGYINKRLKIRVAIKRSAAKATQLSRSRVVPLEQGEMSAPQAMDYGQEEEIQDPEVVDDEEDQEEEIPEPNEVLEDHVYF